MSALPDFTPVEVPARIADLAFTYLRPANFHAVDLPEEKPDFDQPAKFFPLHVAMANFGVVLFSVAARPAYPDGSVEDWAGFLIKEENVKVVSSKPTTFAGMPALMIEVLQESDAGTMRMRTALFEDGKRFLNVSIMAPDAIWPSVESTLQTTLTSFRLAKTHGATTPLMRADVRKSQGKSRPASAVAK